MLKKYGMQDAAEVDSPIDRNVILKIAKDENDCPTDHRECLAIVGSLMYASLSGRPGISYAVFFLVASTTIPEPDTSLRQSASCGTSKEPKVYG